ncbi:MAG: fatty acid desaturase [Rhodospirillales bacterium]
MTTKVPSSQRSQIRAATYDKTAVNKAAINKIGGGVEWPTLFLIVGCYLAFGLLTWFHQSLPLWVFLPLAVYIGGLYGHIQHEVIHGHPTAARRLNAALIFPSIWLWIPYKTSVTMHLTHHRDQHLTSPLRDPESFYVTAEAWAAKGPVARAYLIALNSFAGRLLLSPPRAIALVWWDWLSRLAKGDRSDLSVWLTHLVAMALPLAWAVWLCGLPLWVYLLGFVYGGVALSAMRSFLEHQAAPQVGERICVVESGWFFGFLFLFNNLHIVHHSHPGLAWYRIPGRWRAQRDVYLARNGGYYYRGYAEVVRRYLFKPKEWPVHPGMPEEAGGPRHRAASGLQGTARVPMSTATRTVPAKPA